MKKFVNLSSESGFGLIHVLAATMIASIAVLGLFTSIQYGRRQADINYHTRRSLLLAQGYLEEIRYGLRNAGPYDEPVINDRTFSQNIDEENFKNIMATVNINSTTDDTPYAVPRLTDTFRDEVSVEVVWYERRLADLKGNNATPERRSITLQEDYYWRKSQTGVGY